jgi:hypothetical protein
MAGQPRSNAVKIKELRGLSATLALHGSEVPQLEAARTSLDKLLSQIDELLPQQSFHRSNKQKVSQQLRELILEGIKLATVIRFTLKQHYGNRSEDLVKYGLQPFRGRTRTKKAPEPEIPSTPEEPTAKPADTPTVPST